MYGCACVRGVCACVCVCAANCAMNERSSGYTRHILLVDGHEDCDALEVIAFARRRKGGVNFVMVGRTDPSNSQNGDGDMLVCGRARVCVCARAWVHVCVVMCLQYTLIIFYPG